MKPATDYHLVLVTVGNDANAGSIAEALLKAGLAACVNIVPNIRSIYRWKGKIENDTEFLLLIKTRAEHLSAVEETVRRLHTYDVPEILSVELSQGSKAYLDWLASETDTVEEGKR